MKYRAFAALLLASLCVAGGLDVAAPRPSGAVSPPPLRLTYQTPALSASLAGQAPLTIGLESTAAPSDAKVSGQLFSRLTTRSGLSAALGAQGPSSALGPATTPLALNCLPASSHGGRSLVFNVVTTTTITPTLSGGCAGSSHAPVLNLSCVVGSGRCNGVYPLLLTLSSQGAVLSHLVTLVVFSEHPAPVPLRVGTVLTLSRGATPALIESVARAIKASPTTSLDVSIEPALIATLSATSNGTQALNALRTSLGALESATPSHGVLRSSYVPVDPGALSASGLASEFDAQLRRGSQILGGAGIPSNDTTWLSTAPVTSSTTSALSAAGISRLVVDDASLAEPTTTSLSWGQPFALTPGASSVVAMAADSQLNAEVRLGDGVLGAARTLGDLALLHYERPGLTTPQGVVMRFDAARLSPSALSSLLSGLAEQSVVTPVTLSGLFAQVPQGANGAPSARRLAQNGPSSPWPSSQVALLHLEQQRQTAFASALDSHAPVKRTLSDQLLSAQSDRLNSAGRLAALTTTGAALDNQLHALSINGADITITALRTSIPITLTSSAGYSVTGVLRLTSSHLRFPKGATSTEVLDKPTKSLRIEVEAITTGDLPMSATLTTPQGGLVIAHQRIVVRATHTSLVAIFLTLGAAGVLFAWWFRDWWRRPKRRARS